jgi:hypothetical protein
VRRVHAHAQARAKCTLKCVNDECKPVERAADEHHLKYQTLARRDGARAEGGWLDHVGIGHLAEALQPVLSRRRCLEDLRIRTGRKQRTALARGRAGEACRAPQRRAELPAQERTRVLRQPQIILHAKGEAIAGDGQGRAAR